MKEKAIKVEYVCGCLFVRVAHSATEKNASLEIFIEERVCCNFHYVITWLIA